jgi:DNA-binding transcriptional LysR family regulator
MTRLRQSGPGLQRAEVPTGCADKAMAPTPTENFVRAKSRLNNWSDLQYIIATAKLGSFHSAATALETNQSTVGRRVARFEAYLGTKIFERHATGMQLTAAGKILYDKAMLMEEAANDIETSLLAFDSRLSGTVRIFATEGLSHLWLVRVLADFCRIHPGVNVDLVTDREGLDLFSLEADLAVFIERPKNPRLVASKIVKVEHSLFMSKSYEEQFGRPRKLEELGQHHFVDYVPYQVCADLAWWTKKVTPVHRIQLRADSASVYLAAIRNGMGIGLLPNFYKRAAADLIALPIPTGCSLNLWLVSRPIPNKSHRIKILLKYLRERFNKDRVTWFGA